MNQNPYATPQNAILCHLPALLLFYGWLGLLISILLPIPTLSGVIDGEFVSDGLPRLAACGLWAAVWIIALLFRWLRGMRLNPTIPELNTL
jgi:type VI protein secretion system component VasK